MRQALLTIVQRAYLFRELTIVSLCLGILLHGARLILGNEIALRFVLRPWVDKILAILLILAASAGLLGWKRLRFTGPMHRKICLFILAFVIVSVPIHVATYFGAPMSRLTRFPMWYSFIEALLLYPAFIVAIFRLRLNRPQGDECIEW